MKWIKWNNRLHISEIKEPGIYFIALSDMELTGKPFELNKEIIYIGMSISKKGVLSRLSQFEKGMLGKDGTHGGAERVRFKHKNPDSFFENIYVFVKSFPLKQNDEVYNWKQKGECVKHEYVSFAEYLNNYGELPEFNDQKKSKKK